MITTTIGDVSYIGEFFWVYLKKLGKNMKKKQQFVITVRFNMAEAVLQK